MMHKNIKVYHQSGQIRDDSDFIRIRREMIKVVTEQMHEDGFIPVHDLGPYWYTSMGDKKYYFDLMMYGIYVGKKKALQIDFWHDGNLMQNGRAL